MEFFLADSIEPYIPELSSLLEDCVMDGASIGFLWPMAHQEADEYWWNVEAQRAQGERLCWLAVSKANVIGTVQLAMPSKPNARHRAEVEKLMVHPAYRNKGIARSLMALLQSAAIVHQRTLLVLDTRYGDPASALYRSLGFFEAGQIPGFALNNEGSTDATVYFYKSFN
ncbi:GNAT family N-acetyltransferase [Aliiglaciecola sp. CAU 1673]|uniref:GNAT family N-acetyltransferase n=1 Tax=Aliiglaciecola sp. CAU 1673 TaxID=3032595 RepID=UPI0023DB6BAB|nr:GNAT family N-acetyltransferase [Aliiglaciecola sp. CAU 1673]MDF2179938.1 GNAT family N-acetyltransferase [Aliiglaciecola sp. CAU 1673]